MRTLAAGAAAATVLGVALLVAADGVRETFSWGLVTPWLVALLLLALGAPLARRREGRRVGLLLLGGGVALAASFAGAGYAAVAETRGWPGGPLVRWASEQWLWALAVIPLTTVLLAVFPDGRPPSPRWRPVPWLGWAATGVVAGGAAAGSPLWASSVGGALWTLAGVGGIASLVARWWASAGAARQQVKYLLLAGLLVLFLYAVADVLPYHAQQAAFLAIPLLLVGAVALAVARYRLYDIDVVLRRTAVFAGLTALVFLTYLGVAIAVGADPSERAALVAAVVVAAVAEPARRRLQRAVTRLLFGRRDEPLVALALLRDRLRDATDETALGAAVVDAVPRLLRSRSVAVHLLVDGAARCAAVAGDPGPDAVVLPLVHQSELVGTLVAGLREPGLPYGAADRVLLDEIAHQVAAAAHAVRLRAELRIAADRATRAATAERERLRRDLHDRLGPLLVGTGLAVDGLRHGTEDGTGIDRGLTEIAGQLRTARQEVRRIVDQLAPEQLLDQGLPQAVRDHLDRVARLPGAPVADVRVSVPDALPAAVQQAVYFLVLEALTNVLRHADARRVSVLLEQRGREVVVDVVDDGVGLGEPWVAGVGVSSMRRRCLELGGTFDLGPATGRGTRIHASFPVQEEEPWTPRPRPSASSSPTTTQSSGWGCDDSSTPSPASRSWGRQPTPTLPSRRSAG